MLLGPSESDRHLEEPLFIKNLRKKGYRNEEQSSSSDEDTSSGFNFDN
jgi:hypothetical protein